MRFYLALLMIFVLNFSARAEVFLFPVQNSQKDTLLKNQKDDLLRFIEKTYATELVARNVKLAWDDKWDSAYLGAGSSLYDGTFKILYMGGLSRTPLSTFGSTALTFCHEMGHLLGGAPYQNLSGGSASWSSAEGQSDYYAASDCLVKAYAHFSKTQPEYLSYLNTSKLKPLCATSEDTRMCLWIISAAYDFTQVVSRYFLENKELVNPNLVLNKKIAATNNSNYPDLQCRFDTFKEVALKRSLKNSKPNRSSCWYNADTYSVLIQKWKSKFEKVLDAQSINFKTTYRDQNKFLNLDVIYVTNAGWTMTDIGPRLEKANSILAQCKVSLANVNLIAVEQGIDEINLYRDMKFDKFGSLSNFVKRMGVTPTLTLFMIRQFQEGMAGTSGPDFMFKNKSPEMLNKAFVTTESLEPDYIKDRDAKYSTEAHELGHVLMNTGHVLKTPGNLMSDEYQNVGENLTGKQCDELRSSLLLSN